MELAFNVGPRYNRYMVNTVGKEISEVSRAYLAGFLDGDGAIMATIEKHQEKKFGFRIRVVVKISQKDRKDLEWFLLTFGVGRISSNGRGHDWIVKDRNHAKNILDLMLPYLKVKLNQAKIARKILDLNIKVESYEKFLEIARLTDSLAFLNVRSKNRRSNYSSMVEEVFSRND